jgi:hypothetical protein
MTKKASTTNAQSSKQICELTEDQLAHVSSGWLPIPSKVFFERLVGSDAGGSKAQQAN